VEEETRVTGWPEPAGGRGLGWNLSEVQGAACPHLGFGHMAADRMIFCSIKSHLSLVTPAPETSASGRRKEKHGYRDSGSTPQPVFPTFFTSRAQVHFGQKWFTPWGHCSHECTYSCICQQDLRGTYQVPF
jgi:hypothetical protein